MTYLEYCHKLERIKFLAAHKQTGTPSQLARKLEVSERTLYRMVHQLRELGHPLTFNRFRYSYEVKPK